MLFYFSDKCRNGLENIVHLSFGRTLFNYAIFLTVYTDNDSHHG